MAEIVWTPKALEDLERLLDYISSDAPAAARRYAQKLITHVDILAAHPLLGSYIPEDRGHLYRELRQGNYRVIYRTDGQRVYIVALHHAARLLDSDDLS